MGCAASTASSSQASDAIRGVVPGNATAAEAIPRVKLVLLGESGVGKSCLVLRYVRGQFDPGSKVTIGAAFMSHTVSLASGASVKFEIWDTAGQERYASLAPLYYRGSSAALLVYDITSAESFAKAQHWVKELQKNAGANLVMVLVGNKLDLAEERQVSTEEAALYAEGNGMLFVESSAKTAAHVADIFMAVAERLMEAKSLPQSVKALPGAEDVSNL